MELPTILLLSRQYKTCEYIQSTVANYFRDRYDESFFNFKALELPQHLSILNFDTIWYILIVINISDSGDIHTVKSFLKIIKELQIYCPVTVLGFANGEMKRLIDAASLCKLCALYEAIYLEVSDGGKSIEYAYRLLELRLVDIVSMMGTEKKIHSSEESMVVNEGSKFEADSTASNAPLPKSVDNIHRMISNLQVSLCRDKFSCCQSDSIETENVLIHSDDDFDEPQNNQSIDPMDLISGLEQLDIPIPRSIISESVGKSNNSIEVELQICFSDDITETLILYYGYPIDEQIHLYLNQNKAFLGMMNSHNKKYETDIRNHLIHTGTKLMEAKIRSINRN